MKKLLFTVACASMVLSACSKPAEVVTPETTVAESSTEATTEVQTEAEETTQAEEPTQSEEKEVVNTVRQDAVVSLYNLGVDTEGNWCYSPYSLLDCMSLVAPDVGGKTREEFESLGIADYDFFVEYDKNTPSGLSISNRVYVNEAEAESINTDYVRPGADIAVLPFDAAALNLINHNVAFDTSNKIPSILEDLPQNAVGVFVNAVYFNNKWDFDTCDVPWKGDYVNRRPGFTGDISLEDVGEPTDKIDIVRLRYPDTDFAMYVISPTSYMEDGCDTWVDDFMVNEFSLDMLDNLELKSKYQEANFEMPSFEFDSQPSVQQALNDFGVTSIFTDTADFGQLGALKVSQITQKTYVKVNNKGTEAAAATGMVSLNAMAVEPPPTKYVNVYDNFAFIIRDEKTKTVLFMGRVSDPQGENE